MHAFVEMTASISICALGAAAPSCSTKTSKTTKTI